MVDGARQSTAARRAAVPPRDVMQEVGVRVVAGEHVDHTVARFGPGS